MIDWMLHTALLATPAAATVWIDWRRATRGAALALLGYSILSSYADVSMPFVMQPLFEIGLVTMVSTACAMIWAAGDTQRAYAWAVAIAMLDVAICAAIIIPGDFGLDEQLIFAWASNIAYGGLCIAIALPGVRDAYDGWIADIARMRRMADPAVPADMQWAVRQLDHHG